MVGSGRARRSPIQCEIHFVSSVSPHHQRTRRKRCDGKGVHLNESTGKERGSAASAPCSLASYAPECQALKIAAGGIGGAIGIHGDRAGETASSESIVATPGLAIGTGVYGPPGLGVITVPEWLLRICRQHSLAGKSLAALLCSTMHPFFRLICPPQPIERNGEDEMCRPPC